MEGVCAHEYRCLGKQETLDPWSWGYRRLKVCRTWVLGTKWALHQSSVLLPSEPSLQSLEKHISKAGQ